MLKKEAITMEVIGLLSDEEIASLGLPLGQYKMLQRAIATHKIGIGSLGGSVEAMVAQLGQVQLNKSPIVQDC